MRPVGKICSCPVLYGVQSWDLEKTGYFGALWSCSQQRKNKKKNKDTPQTYLALMGSKDPSQILEVFRQRSLIDRVSKVPLRRDSFPNAQLLPLSGKTDHADRSSLKATTDADPVWVTATLSSSPFCPGLPLKAGRSHRTGKGRECERPMLYTLYLLQVSECRPHQWKLCLTRKIGSPQIQGRQRAGQQGALWTTLEGSISPSTNIKWGSSRVAGKCRTAQAISSRGWSSGLSATWLFPEEKEPVRKGSIFCEYIECCFLSPEFYCSSFKPPTAPFYRRMSGF